MDEIPEAWVELPTEESIRELMAGGQNPYDFGFLPAMVRLVFAHAGIAPAFGMAFATIMFGPGALRRTEREMVAAVSAAAQDCFY